MQTRDTISRRGASAVTAGLRLGLALMIAGCTSTEKMGLAPVSVSGSVQTVAVNRYTSDGSSEVATTATANVGLKTYVWHPWFATVSSDLGVGYDFSTGDAKNSALRAGGNVTLDILPQSNYPVSISAGHHESRISGDFVSGDLVRDHASLSARAAITPTIKGGFLASWDRTDRDDSGVRTGLRTNISLDKSFPKDSAYFGIKSIGFQAGLRRNDFTATDPNESDSNFDNANIRLTLRSEPAKNVLVDTRLSGLLLDVTTEDDDEKRLIAQGLTTVQWRPESLPINVTGALRVLYEDVSQVDAGRTLERSTKLASATVGMRWPVNDNLSLNVGLRASYEDIARDEGIDFEGDNDETGARFEAGFLVGANYRSNKYNLGGFDWRWNAQILTNNGLDTEAGFDSRDLFQVGHVLERRLEDLLSWPVLFSISQAFDVRLDTEDDDGLLSAGINHSVSLGYNRADRESSGFARLTIRDSRNVIGETRSFQSVQFRLGERLALSRFQRISGNVNAQAARSVDSEGDSETSASLSAEVRYEHRELFEVEGLFFRSILRANILDVEALFGADEETFNGFETLSNDWRNILTYRIGRLTAEAEASAFHRDGGFGYLVLVRLRREFGGTF